MRHEELTLAERQRYARHLSLPTLGEAGQLALKRARVLVIGAGGLGAPLLTYLAAAGVGAIGIVDPDRVSISNLQRQVLFGQRDLGRLKVEAARERLLDLNPHLQVDVYPVAFTRHNALQLLAQYDLVADGADNFPTRYLVNDACVLAGKTHVYAAVYRFEGQVSVFNHPLPSGERGPNYRDLYPTPPPPGAVPSCAEGGILGVLPGIIGSLQANEVIKAITGIGQTLTGRLFVFDAATFTTRTLGFKARPDTHITHLVDYEAFCGMPHAEELPSLDVATLRALLARHDELTLLDVREPAEYAADNLGGQLIPLAQLPQRLTELPPHRLTVVHCQSGQRSQQAVQWLQTAGFTQVFNLIGGLDAWRAAEATFHPDHQHPAPPTSTP